MPKEENKEVGIYEDSNKKHDLDETIVKKSNKLILPIVTGLLFALTLGIVLIVLFSSGKLGKKRNNPEFDDKYLEDPSYDTTTLAYSELLEIAAKALDEGNYDEAIQSYNKVLEMDDSVTDAYLGLVEAYIRKGDFEEALGAAKEGYDKTGDSRLEKKISMLEEGNVKDSRGLSYKETTYGANHQVMFWHTFDYDNTGKQVSVTSFDPTGKQTGYVNFVSDNPNVVILYGSNGGTGEVSKIEREMDGNGKVIKEIKYNVDGSVWGYCLFEYEGSKTIETQYGMDENIQYRYISYQEGNKSIWEGYDYDQNTGEFRLYHRQVTDGNRTDHYDGNGNLECYVISEDGKRTEYNPDGSLKEYSVRE